MNRSLTGQNIVVFDLEIKNPIENGITWGDHHLMGISVGVAFSFRTREFGVYMDDNLHELIELLNQADIVTGFNIKGFDIPLLNKTPSKTGAQFLESKPGQVYDLLEESRLASGWTPSQRFPSGMKLDDHLLGTFGEQFMKTANGAEAPLMYQRGELGKLISYCVADVHREAIFFEHVWNGYPVNTAGHGWRKLASPQARIASDVSKTV